MSFLGMGARIFREILAIWTLFHIMGPSSKSNCLAYHFRRCLSKKQLKPYDSVSHGSVARGESDEIFL